MVLSLRLGSNNQSPFSFTVRLLCQGWPETLLGRPRYVPLPDLRLFYHGAEAAIVRRNKRL
jgi:hypothetical protein